MALTHGEKTWTETNARKMTKIVKRDLSWKASKNKKNKNSAVRFSPIDLNVNALAFTVLATTAFLPY